MAKLIAGASIASTAGDTPPNGSRLANGSYEQGPGHSERNQEYA